MKPQHSEEIPDTEVDSTPEYYINRCDSIISVASRASDRAELERISKSAGEQRDAFLSSLRLVSPESTAITVKYGNATVSVSATGKAVVEPGGALVRHHPAGVHPDADKAILGSAPGNKKIGDTMIPCGVCLIIAGGGSGKTPLAHALASFGVSSYSVVRVGEPLAGYSSSHESVAFSLANSMLSSSDIVLDSIKDLLSGGGAAMKSGLSRDALVSISGLASTACSSGCTIYIPVNPSTPDPEVIELLAEISRSNATMTVVTKGSNSWDYVARKGESLNRSSGTMLLTYDKDGVGQVRSASLGEVSSNDEIERRIAMVVSGPAMSSAFRRATENH